MADHSPYVTVAFTNRNDNYGGDLAERFRAFIGYYEMYAARYPGVFEFVICDWNPPENAPQLRDAYPWHRLGCVKHVVVPNEVHARIANPSNRPMHDYIGRNVAIRRGSGEFVLVINQDIFIGDSIMTQIGERQLRPDCFYRADRCDFRFESFADVGPGDYERCAWETLFVVHRRQRPTSDASTSVPAEQHTVHNVGTQIEPEDEFSPETLLAVSRLASLVRADDVARARAPASQSEGWRREYGSDGYYRRFRLHTNAAGDFLLAHRRAFDEIHGLSEATDFYMHLDSYAVIQLFAAGYRQAIFCQSNRVYHADHDRSGRANVREGVSWEEHERRFSQILREEMPYRMNGADWGLASEALPESEG